MTLISSPDNGGIRLHLLSFQNSSVPVTISNSCSKASSTVPFRHLTPPDGSLCSGLCILFLIKAFSLFSLWLLDYHFRRRLSIQFFIGTSKKIVDFSENIWYNTICFGVWRSLVARTAGGREVAGSNPVAPIACSEIKSLEFYSGLFFIL